MIQNILSLIRIKHWIKNSFVFLPSFFAGNISDAWNPQFILLFFAFCFTASSIYIINDLVDIDHDSSHPEKQKRPLASGSVRLPTAIRLLFFTSSIAVILSLQLQIPAYGYIITYVILNLLYTFKLKQIALIDVSCISLGFVIRVVAGSVLGGIYLSPWMIIMVFLLTISIAFAKRRDDFFVEMEKKNERKANEGYSLPFLDLAIIISFSVTLVAYISYSVSPDVMNRLGSEYIYVTSIFVFLGIMRYLQLSVVYKKAGSPVKLLFEDLFLNLTILAWIITFAFLLYG